MSARVGPFNHPRVPTEVVLLGVLWRQRDKQSVLDLAQMFLPRGFTCTPTLMRSQSGRFRMQVARTPSLTR
jgi:hypothetical protein